MKETQAENEAIPMTKKIGGITIIGTPEKVANMTEEDLAESLKYENLPRRLQVLFEKD
jgi:alkanesulfonate monooxygenase SsuD/methylene tetrahydromethanopterin reductase-like flavin-dependent oxidoreductase (luciferase family)